MRFGVVAGVLVLFACSAFAQQGGYNQTPGSYGQPQGGPSQPQGGYGKPDSNLTTPPTRINRPTKSKPKAPSKEQILADAAALVKAAPLACEVADAALINDGMADINGQTIHVRTFETACANGMGYFLVEQPPQKTMGFSCFAADATRARDIAAGREPQPTCALTANSDRETMAGTILSKLGISCQVRDVRWIGEETGAGAELTEAACAGGTGYVIRSALPGSTAAVSASTCPESYRRGVSCKLSSNGAPLITLQTFKDALAAQHIACTGEVVRSMGKEVKSQRHVVEFKCNEFPDGLVALIPLEGNPAPFETMDCAKAAQRYHQLCVLTQTH